MTSVISIRSTLDSLKHGIINKNKNNNNNNNTSFQKCMLKQ